MKNSSMSRFSSRLPVLLALVVCLALPGCYGNPDAIIIAENGDVYERPPNAFGDTANFLLIENTLAPRDRAGSRLSRFHLTSGTTFQVIVALNKSSRVFISDGNSPWGTADLGRYIASGPLTINTGILSGDQLLIGTSQGLAWLNMR